MHQETIRIESKSVYGRTNYYIISEHANHIAGLTGKKTVDLRDVRNLQALGFRVVMAGRPEMPALESVLA